MVNDNATGQSNSIQNTANKISSLCLDCKRVLLNPYNHSPRCMNCNSIRRRILDGGFLSTWVGVRPSNLTPIQEIYLKVLMKAGFTGLESSPIQVKSVLELCNTLFKAGYQDLKYYDMDITYLVKLSEMVARVPG